MFSGFPKGSTSCALVESARTSLKCQKRNSQTQRRLRSRLVCFVPGSARVFGCSGLWVPCESGSWPPAAVLKPDKQDPLRPPPFDHNLRDHLPCISSVDCIVCPRLTDFPSFVGNLFVFPVCMWVEFFLPLKTSCYIRTSVGLDSSRNFVWPSGSPSTSS